MGTKAEWFRRELPIMLDPGGYGHQSLYLTDVDENVLYFSSVPTYRREDAFPVHIHVLQEIKEVLGGKLPVGVRRDENEDGDPVLVVLDWADEIAGAKRSSVETLEETEKRTGLSAYLFDAALAVSRSLAEQADGGH